MKTLRSDSQSVAIDVAPSEAFAFLADPANLPRWAVGFARAVRQEGEQWVVETAAGDVPVTVVADAEQGTIDFAMTVAPDTVAIAYSRVLPNAAGAEYVFTQFQSPGMPDEVFANQRAALTEELRLLPILFRAQAFCPIGG